MKQMCMITNSIVYKNVVLKFFCDDIAYIGDLMFKKRDCIVESYRSADVGDQIIGISLHNVIKPDATINYHDPMEVPVGNKIQILQEGDFTAKLPNWGLPYGQNLYFDVRSGEVGWKKTQLKYGKTISEQDNEGYVRIKVKF